MKKFYTRSRIFILTFAFGLACVSLLNGLYTRSTAIPVDLPQSSFESPIIVYPIYTSEMKELPAFPESEARGTRCQVEGGGGTEENEIKRKVEKERRK